MSPWANIVPHCVPKLSASLYLAYLGRRELIGRNVDGDNAGQDGETLHRYTGRELSGRLARQV